MTRSGERAHTNGKQATRELILETFKRMVVEDGLHDVSIQQVADQAGITHRTVYRYFKSRQELVDQLAEWLHERGIERGGTEAPEQADDIPRAVRINSRVFDQDADLIKALVLVTWGTRTLAAAQRQRTDAFERALAPLTSHLEPSEARAVNAVVRYLASSRTWLAFRDEYGLSGEESGPIVAWTIELLLDALREQARPGPQEARRKEAIDGEAGGKLSDFSFGWFRDAASRCRSR